MHRVAVELYAILDFQNVKFCAIRHKSVSDGLNGVHANIAVNESTAQFIGHCCGDTASTKEVGYYHPLVGRSIDYPFQYPILTLEEKNRLWKLVLKKVTIYRSPDDEITIQIHPNLPK